MTADQFVRASRLYDVEAGERIHWDWAGEQSVLVSEATVEQAIAELDREG